MAVAAQELMPVLELEVQPDVDQFVTADGLLELSVRDDNRYELIDGKVRAMPPAGAEHGYFAMGLGAAMFLFASNNQLGAVFAAETGFILERNPDTVRAPDTGFVRRDRLPVPLTGKYFPGAPDLAVEVVSPNDRADEVQDKVQDWLAHGTQLVLVVEPKSRTVTIFRPDGTANVLQATDTLDGEDVLPGFRFPLSRLWG
jgi:Uma2 family endonuclease